MYSRFKVFKKLMVIIFFVFNFLSFSQSKKILIFHKTDGYRHPSIGVGINMFEDLGNEFGDWDTDNSNNSNVFTSSNLSQYNAVVFLNTSGDNLLTDSEQIALENFITNGNGFIGIHAATDTYRNKSWPFYNELVGGILQYDPNHTSSNFNADIEVKMSHPITDFIGSVGSIWNKNEEYYYWERNGGELSNDNSVLLEVESTGSNSYDAARPITWYKESITYDDDGNPSTSDITLSGIKSFYTALGHNESDYTGNTDFRTMLKNAVLWATESSTLSIREKEKISSIQISKNPVRDKVQIFFDDFNEDLNLKVYDISGKQVVSKLVNHNAIKNNIYELNITNYTSGLYFFLISTQTSSKSFKILKI